MSKVSQHRFTCKSANLIHLDEETCTYNAKTCQKVSVEQLQAILGEGHNERNAQVVYANISSLREVLTNELPGVFLTDICS